MTEVVAKALFFSAAYYLLFYLLELARKGILQASTFELCIWTQQRLSLKRATGLQLIAEKLEQSEVSWSLQLMEWAHEVYNLEAQDSSTNDLVWSALKSGKLEVLKWLQDRVSVKALVGLHSKEALKECASRGHLEVLKWLHQTFALTVEDVRADNNYALRRSAANGRLEVLKWLHQTFALTIEDVRADNNHALRWSSNNGHLKVLKWLHQTFALTVEDVPAV